MTQPSIVIKLNDNGLFSVRKSGRGQEFTSYSEARAYAEDMKAKAVVPTKIIDLVPVDRRV
jgi:hypothetical protein